jgi:DNA adenine methylase
MDFRKALSQAANADIVYCDPPYVPLTATASFTSYAAAGFTEEDQKDLCKLALAARDRGAIVAISNHDTPFTRTLYKAATRVESLMVSRTISCDGQNRNKAKELIAIF